MIDATDQFVELLLGRECFPEDTYFRAQVEAFFADPGGPLAMKYVQSLTDEQRAHLVGVVEQMTLSE